MLLYFLHKFFYIFRILFNLREEKKKNKNIYIINNKFNSLY
jgi:hypothetical protein